MAKEASSRIYTNTEIFEDIQTEIKELIARSVFKAGDMLKFMERAEKIINAGLEEIDDEKAKEIGRESLLNFAREQFRQTVQLLDLGNLPLILAFVDQETKQSVNEAGVQSLLNENLKKLGRVAINRAFSNLGNSQAKVGRTQSLYGWSEMNERRNEQRNMIKELREKTRLVICDTHSDCSDRCFKWQGRVYSLDGTSGRTDDGREYIPLEVAVNDTTFGLHNGLLGYNCRHKLVEYKKGKKPIKVSRTEQKREYALSEKQRLLEREIRSMKDLAVSFENVDKEKFKFYKLRATQLTREYKTFCHENNRVEYRSRLTI